MREFSACYHTNTERDENQESDASMQTHTKHCVMAIRFEAVGVLGGGFWPRVA